MQILIINIKSLLISHIKNYYLIYLILLLAGCSPAILIDPFFPTTYSKPSNEEYQVILDILKSTSKEKSLNNMDIKECYIIDPRRTSRLFAEIEIEILSIRIHGFKKEVRKKITLHTLRDFQKKNHFPMRFDISKLTNIKTIPYDRKMFERKKSCRTNWESLYNKYDNLKGIFQFSRIGFNKTQDIALIYFERHSGCLAAWGGLIVLQKINNKWEILDRKTEWVS